jgi:hypothetical protein
MVKIFARTGRSRITGLLLGFCLPVVCGLLVLFYRLSAESLSVVAPSEPRSTDASTPPSGAPAHDWDLVVLADPIAPSAPPEDPGGFRVLPDVMDFESPAEEITVHMASDFLLGDRANVVVDGPLRLGDGAGFPPRGAPPGQRSGVYISPEQEPAEPFDILVAEAEAVISDGSDVVFEFRTRALEGGWSVWERIEANAMSQPIGLGLPAAAWQYRLTFFADETAAAPEVHSVAFATRPVLRGFAEDLFPADQPGDSR